VGRNLAAAELIKTTPRPALVSTCSTADSSRSCRSMKLLVDVAAKCGFKTQSGETESVREPTDQFDAQSNFENRLVQEKHIPS
jgi:hypothetical protein